MYSESADKYIEKLLGSQMSTWKVMNKIHEDDIPDKE